MSKSCWFSVLKVYGVSSVFDAFHESRRLYMFVSGLGLFGFTSLVRTSQGLGFRV